jgi:hypothetical protein
MSRTGFRPAAKLTKGGESRGCYNPLAGASLNAGKGRAGPPLRGGRGCGLRASRSTDRHARSRSGRNRP